MRKLHALLLLAVFAAGLSLADFVVQAEEDKVVARVNGNAISESELKLAEAEIGTDLANVPAEQRRIVLVEYLIENRLLADAAESEKMGTGPEFQQRLEYYKNRALRDAYYEKKVNEAVDTAEAKKIYDQQVSNLKPEQEVRARHILVEDEAKAKDLLEKLANGADFAELAQKNSKGPSAAQGGDLGYFSKGRMVKSFEDAAFALEKGEISEPVKSEFGWHIIKVEEKRDRPVPEFESVKDRIIASLVQRKRQEIVLSLRKNAKIEIVDSKLAEQRKALQGSFGGQ